jgi:hypothetical protein
MTSRQPSQLVDPVCGEAETTLPTGNRPVGTPLDLANSPALRRLVEEVRIEGDAAAEHPLAYNRTYNRHNR